MAGAAPNPGLQRRGIPCALAAALPRGFLSTTCVRSRLLFPQATLFFIAFTTTTPDISGALE
ncbi:hypothetical protein BGZ96_010673 [Linnemannia gamsii]|uniref:Uncharacterized protein n=1 Tax=Linnemannia gamsii TaxID=64522 RepID=A0ABQ7JUQ3_9FUNG|nr:hypothetical protein BGZ96_010673 [Linnemannia gamsii]